MTLFTRLRLRDRGEPPTPIGRSVMTLDIDLSAPGAEDNTFTFYAARTSEQPPFTIDWGDGTTDTVTDTDPYAPRTHTYGDAGTYTVTIRGELDQFSNDSGNDQTGIAPLIAVTKWDDNGVTSLQNGFSYAYNLTTVAAPPATVTDMSYLFYEARALVSLPDWDTRHVVNMSYMFNDARVFDDDIGGWDTGNVTDMSYMFQSAAAFNQDIGDWDTSNVTDMEAMFSGASSFVQDISGWNVAQIPTEPDYFAADTSPSWTPAMRPIWGTVGAVKIETLVDDFSTWQPWWTSVATAGVAWTMDERLRIEATTDYPHATTAPAYDLTDSSVFVELEAPPAAASRQSLMEVGPDENNLLMIFVSDDPPLLNCRATTADASTEWTTVPYDPVEMRYLRIRHAGSTVYWDTAPAANGPWTVQSQAAQPSWSLRFVSVILKAGNWGSLPGGVFAYFDNLNVAA